MNIKDFTYDIYSDLYVIYYRRYCLAKAKTNEKIAIYEIRYIIKEIFNGKCCIKVKKRIKKINKKIRRRKIQDFFRDDVLGFIKEAWLPFCFIIVSSISLSFIVAFIMILCGFDIR